MQTDLSRPTPLRAHDQWAEGRSHAERLEGFRVLLDAQSYSRPATNPGAESKLGNATLALGTRQLVRQAEPPGRPSLSRSIQGNPGRRCRLFLESQSHHSRQSLLGNSPTGCHARSVETQQLSRLRTQNRASRLAPLRRASRVLGRRQQEQKGPPEIHG